MTAQVWVLVGVVVMLVLLVLLGFLTRLRSLAGRVGSFECAWRAEGAAHWTSGVATFGDDALNWYRLMSFAPRPARSWARADLEVGLARARRQDGHVVEVTCTYRGSSVEMAMVEDSHFALVAWTESAAPTQPSLF